MRVLRVALAAALCAAVVLTLQRSIVTRHQCSAEKKRTELWLETARESGSLNQQMAIARGAIPRLLRCAENDPSDYETLFLLGSARRTAEQHDGALQAFEASLALNERPETYMSIGLLHLEKGEAEQARRNMLQAVYFNLDMIDHVDAAMRHELQTAMEERQARLRTRGGS